MTDNLYELYKKHLSLLKQIGQLESGTVKSMNEKIVNEFISIIDELGVKSTDAHEFPVKYHGKKYLLCLKTTVGIKIFNKNNKQFGRFKSILNTGLFHPKMILYMIKNAEPLIPYIKETKRKYFSAIIELAKNIQLYPSSLEVTEINESYAALLDPDMLDVYEKYCLNKQYNPPDYFKKTLFTLILFGGKITSIKITYKGLFIEYIEGNRKPRNLRLNFKNISINLPYLEPVMPHIEHAVSILTEQNKKTLARLDKVKTRLRMEKMLLE